jgi:two-component system nitrogen regulation response regulator GlnG
MARLLLILLIVDDDPALLLEQVKDLFARRGVQIDIAHGSAEALEQIAIHPPDVVLLDASMQDISAIELHERVRQIDVRIPVIFITAITTVQAAIEATRRGAYDFLSKPINLKQLDKVVTNALALSRHIDKPAEIGNTDEIDDHDDTMIGQCPAMREVYKAIGRVADQNVIVLVTGESGTGKELVARAIYQHSQRV